MHEDKALRSHAEGGARAGRRRNRKVVGRLVTGWFAIAVGACVSMDAIPASQAADGGNSAIREQGHSSATEQDTVTASATAVAYSEQQASRGAQVYEEFCESCHQANLGGNNTAKPLKGPPFAEKWQAKTARDLVSKIRKTMPNDDPGTLTDEQARDVLAYILKRNGYASSDRELPSEPALLARMNIGRPSGE